MTKKEIRKAIAKHYSIVASHIDVDLMLSRCAISAREVQDVVFRNGTIAFNIKDWLVTHTSERKLIRWEDFLVK